MTCALQVFTEFELESHLDCTYDWVQIYDGPDSQSSPSMGTFCGSKLPPPLVTTGGSLYMTFKSDSSVQRRGFYATHSTGTWHCNIVAVRR